MKHTKGYTLQQLAEYLDGRVIGDPDYRVYTLATLEEGGENQLSFFANSRYLQQLKATASAAVLVNEDALEHLPRYGIVLANPYLAFARVSQLFDWRSPVQARIHSSAIVDPAAHIHPDAEVAANAVIEAEAVISAGVYVGPGCVVGRACVLGENTRLEANVTCYPDVQIGENCLVHSGAVLGADGFGFARAQGKWVKICQLGGVRIGDHVEIGANTTIDRGALSPTRIGNGVKLDNQIQIAHNVHLGDDVAIAGCTAVAGSTKIGARCTIAGMCGITGHLTIAADTHVTAMTLVSKSISQPGAYSSGTGLEEHSSWKRNVVRFRQLDQLSRRVKELEKNLHD